MVNSPFLTLIRVTPVARKYLPRMIGTSSSSKISRMLKSAGNTKLSTLTNASSILP